ncbi:sigma-70 family RNA polymerase sigma factor [Thermoanaerobacter mathranii]|uniref:sigma-70 family RNA polymerase sigma factor n=1 Tax=Thermoanaerobacter mathranii TaxID=583357 RepID=UPI003D6BA21E
MINQKELYNESFLYTKSKEELESSEEIDIVSLYLKQAGEFPLLSSDEEKALIKKAKSGDREARQRLIECNLKLVISIAKKYASSPEQLMDLIQEGNIGLLKAVERFDPSKGVRFSTYAVWWIRQTISRAVQNSSKTVRLPVHVEEKITKLYKTRERLSQELGYDPNIEEIATEMGIQPEKAEELYSLSGFQVSLDMPVDDDETTLLGDLVSHPRPEDPEEKLERENLKELLKKALDRLPEREREVLTIRFNLNDEYDYKPSLRETAEKFNLSRERIRQLEKRALNRLRRYKEIQEIKKQFFLT